MSVTIVKETAPHIRRKATVGRMMLDVIIALMPVVIFSFVAFGLAALKIIGISLLTWVGTELLYIGFRYKFKEFKKHFTINNVLAPMVSAIIFAMILPASASWYAVLIGSLFGSIFGKLVFGGLGQNIFNPAAVGMLAVKIMFGSKFTYESNWLIPVSTGGTPLASTVGATGLFEGFNSYSVLDLFLGRCPGTLGEISAACIIIGMIYLIIRRSADYRVMFAYLGTALFYFLITGIVFTVKLNVNYFQYIGYEMFSGGLMFAGVFMLTDPVTSPTNKPNRILYGMIAASLTVIIRLLGGFPEGAGFSILIANMLVPVLGYYKWSTPKFKARFFIIAAVIILVTSAALILGLLFGGRI